ncbi:fibronectin type III domain-containing protein [Blastococcus sp. SYSU DS1024]
MNAVRRALAVTGLAVAVTAGATVPAWAALTGTAALSTTISTPVIQPPTAVSTAGSWCFLGFGARISWTPSTSADVSGYVVTARRSDGTTFVVGRTGPQGTSVSETYWASGRSYTFTVTAETPYGWTATSAPTAAVTC